MPDPLICIITHSDLGDLLGSQKGDSNATIDTPENQLCFFIACDQRG
jgi:hypothetical protein